MKQASKVALATLTLVATLTVPVMAEDEKKTGWFDTAELSFVSTSGNAETQTLGFNNRLQRLWENAAFTFNAGGVSAESRASGAAASIDAGGVVTIVEPPKQTTAENFFANFRYDRNITDRFFWYGIAGWDRNELSGIADRFQGGAGVGNIWVNRDDVKFRTDYGLTFTDESFTVGTSDSYAGARLSWGYLNKLTDSTTYFNDFVVNFNLDESDDYRADMVNAVQVSMSKRVALKASLQLLYDNMPAIESVPVVADLTGSGQTEVLRPRDDMDTIFAASLVVNF